VCRSKEIRPREQSKVENECERLIDRLLLGRRQASRELIETLDIDRSKLFYEHPRALIAKIDLGPEGRRQRALGCGRKDRG
jgi:hypothetical protein